MARKPRTHYTETDKALMWDRWRKGDSLEKIEQLFDRTHGSVARILRQTGGIQPPKRTRSRHALSLAEREEISRDVVAGRSLRSIAASLNRAPSTISRELSRNGGRQQYRANVADEAAWDRAHRPKTCKLGQNPALARIVASKLQLEWSPRQIATLVERQSRYVLLARVKSKDTETVINALIKQAHKLPRELYKSLTWDRGKEMADHKRFTLDTDIKVYFCDPQSPWQRGSNENTNGLLRQYFPKGMDLSNVHQNRLNAVARRLNERPRETLNFETPAERFNQSVASTG